MRGKFIVFDGPDGSGKSTQIKKVAAELEKEGIPVYMSREPGGSPLGEKIREIILSEEGKQASAKTMLCLFIAQRLEHLEKTILPKLEKGITVLVDRHDSSSWAYQVCAQGNSNGSLRNLFWKLRDTFFPAQNKMRPDWYIIFDVPIEVSLERIKARGRDLSHFEARGAEFLTRIRKGMLEFADSKDVHAMVINGDRPAEEITRDVMQALMPLFK